MNTPPPGEFSSRSADRQTSHAASGAPPSAVSNLKRRGKCTLPLILAAAELTGKPVTWFLFGTALPETQPPDRTGQTAVAEDHEFYRDIPNLLRLCERRLAALEEWARTLESRLDRLEDTSDPDTSADH
jgi:hypothetical protein